MGNEHYYGTLSLATCEGDNVGFKVRMLQVKVECKRVTAESKSMCECVCVWVGIIVVA